LALARRRADEDGLDVEFLQGDAEKLPVAGDFDVVLSVFGVIFAADAARATREMIRATRLGGTVVLTSWCREGAINAAADVLFAALPERDGPAPRWDDAQWIESLLIQEGSGRVTIDDAQHVFRAESPEAWFAETEDRHPVWRWARRLVPGDRWELVRRESLAALREGNEDPDRFATTSRYLHVQATR
jgi:SAM-dependent methyltransferase